MLVARWLAGLVGCLRCAVGGNAALNHSAASLLWLLFWFYYLCVCVRLTDSRFVVSLETCAWNVNKNHIEICWLVLSLLLCWTIGNVGLADDFFMHTHTHTCSCDEAWICKVTDNILINFGVFILIIPKVWRCKVKNR